MRRPRAKQIHEAMSSNPGGPHNGEGVSAPTSGVWRVVSHAKGSSLFVTSFVIDRRDHSRCDLVRLLNWCSEIRLTFTDFVESKRLNMSRKIMLPFLFSCLIGTFWLPPCVAVERSNILLILADDLGYGDLGCYGRDDIQTPVLDQLAKQGVRFTDHYANGPECTPTRVALLTGRYQQWVGGLECAIGTGNVGRYDDAIRLREQRELGLPTDQQTIVRLMKEAGYRTAITGKWHLGYEPKFAPHLHGFDHTLYCIGGGMDYFHYLDNVAGYNLFQDGNPIRREGYFTDLLTDEAIGFLDEQRGDETPFFLYVPYTCPHFPFQGPEDAQPNPLPLDSPLWIQNEAPPETYISMIEHMDARIGDLLAALDRNGLRQSTVVIFASDNGGSKSARNAPFSGHKGSTYEGGIRVPAMVRWPGVIPEGIESDQPCITFDFTASIARIAGVQADRDRPWDGMDILAHVANRKPNVTRTLFWRKPRGDSVWMGLREGTMKLVIEKQADRQSAALFDLSKDPAEKNDLGPRQPQELDRLIDLYQTWESRVRRDRRGQPDA